MYGILDGLSERTETDCLRQKQKEAGDCQNGGLYLPGKAEPGAVGDRSQTETDQKDRVSWEEDIAETISITECKYSRLTGDPYQIGKGSQYRHQEKCLS